MPYFLIVLKTLASLMEGVFLKKYNSRSRSDSGLIFMSLISLCSMLFFVFTHTGPFRVNGILIGYAVISGILYCSASFLTFLALSLGSFAMTMLVLSYSIVFSIAYGLFFLNEKLSAFAYIGMLLLFLSLFLVRSPKETGEKKKVTMRWLVCMVLSLIGSGMYGVLQRMQQITFNDERTNEFMILSLGLSFLLLFMTGLFRDRSHLKEIFRPDLLYSLGAGLSNGITNLLGLIVYLMIPIAISSPFSSGVKIVLSFLISTLIFKEKFLKRQILGAALGTAALVLLNL